MLNFGNEVYDVIVNNDDSMITYGVPTFKITIPTQLIYQKNSKNV